MKIEKISETQIKFILSRTDLEDRNIKLEELSTPSDKTQDLFRDIMEQAMEEYHFAAENAPLMVEAVPVASDGIMIIVTKLSDTDSAESKLTLLSQSKDVRRFKRKSLISLETETIKDDSISIFSFIKLDDVIDVSARLYNSCNGFNSLYKHNDKYFLIVHYDKSLDSLSLDNMELILSEYGTKHVSTVLSKYYLMEHGELILQNPALKTLAKSFAI